jgi:hypothetical protein
MASFINAIDISQFSLTYCITPLPDLALPRFPRQIKAAFTTQLLKIYSSNLVPKKPMARGSKKAT